LPKIVDFVRGSDAVRTPGTWQADEKVAHTHTFNVASDNPTVANANRIGGAYPTGGVQNLGTITTSSTGGPETRPRNVAMLYCVKAFDSPTNQGMIDITAMANEVAGKVNLSEFTGTNQSKTANGWQKLPGGLILQWNNVTPSPTITFPIAFPNACFTVVSQNISTTTTAWANSVAAITKTGFTNYNGSPVGFYYIAIGY
jgi:hypothetical protein